MAAIRVYITDKENPHPEGLCPTCWNPALKAYILERIDMTGVTPIGRRTGCRDCNTWITPLEPLEATA